VLGVKAIDALPPPTSDAVPIVGGLGRSSIFPLLGDTLLIAICYAAIP
jgi:hypothetical protein